jgi:hypothetical protein
MPLSFIRNKTVEVEPLVDNSLSVIWRLADNLTEAEVRLRVRPPDLEVAEASARLLRFPHPECIAMADSVSKIVGVRVGPGLRKIVDGLMGGTAGCPELIEGVLECANAVILHFSVPEIRQAAKLNEEEKVKRYRDMLQLNPRLAGSCIAFADGSPLMKDNSC